jgi:TRAP-type C4-dicarboxylate transport system permease small subunit
MLQYVRIVSALSRIAGWISIGLMIAAALVVTEMVVIRYALRASTVWQTEFVTFALVAATFLGSPYVLLEKGHVAVDVLPLAAGPRGRVIMAIIAGLIGITFCALLAWSASHYFIEAWSNGWRTETVWALPLWIPILPMPLGVGLLVLQYIAEIWQAARGNP